MDRSYTVYKKTLGVNQKRIFERSCWIFNGVQNKRSRQIRQGSLPFGNYFHGQLSWSCLENITLMFEFMKHLVHGSPASTKITG